MNGQITNMKITNEEIIETTMRYRLEHQDLTNELRHSPTVDELWKDVHKHIKKKNEEYEHRLKSNSLHKTLEEWYTKTDFQWAFIESQDKLNFQRIDDISLYNLVRWPEIGQCPIVKLK